MEAVAIGTLLEATCDTVCWNVDTKLDIHIPQGQTLLFLGVRMLTGHLHRLSVAKVIHPEHGALECLACDLKMIENIQNNR
jgi:hypothetical protein